MLPESHSITAALLRERLAATEVPKNPTEVVMPPGSERLPAFVREQLLATLKPAGVLIPVIERPSGLTVLLTRRSAALKYHASQVSFPGGRMEKTDRDIVHTALRETHEEVGIPSESIAVIGYLQPMPTVTGYAVTPVIGLVTAAVSLELDRMEVEYAFEVPLPFLLDGRNQRASEREFRGHRIPTVEFHYEDEQIWGATAHMLVELRKLLLK